MYRYLSSLIAILVLGVSHLASAGQPYVLPSGKTIEILGAGPIKFGNRKTALVLQYQTKTPLTEMGALTKEVNELWDRFIADVEKGGYEGAVISAHEQLRGFIVKSGNSYNFIFEKKDNAWRMHEPEKREKLNKYSIIAFFNRMEWLATHKALNAIFLYFPNDYAVTVAGEMVGPTPVTLNRLQYAATLQQAFAAMTNYEVRRDILDIVLFENGKKARVESRMFETGKLGAKAIETVTRVTDMLELRNGFLQILRSSGVIEKQAVVDVPQK